MAVIEGSSVAHGLQFAIVVSRFNDFVTGRLRDGAVAALRERGAAPDAVDILWVPGAFEIPLAAQRAAETGRYAAIVCLGCLIRGATPHFDYISSAVCHGITSAPCSTGTPMAFCVLTTNSAE